MRSRIPSKSMRDEPTHVRWQAVVTRNWFWTCVAISRVLSCVDPSAPYVTVMKLGLRPTRSERTCCRFSMAASVFGGNNSKEIPGLLLSLYRSAKVTFFNALLFSRKKPCCHGAISSPAAERLDVIRRAIANPPIKLRRVLQLLTAGPRHDEKPAVALRQRGHVAP